MPQSQSLFFRKSNYIYNKITYLAIAIIGIVILLDSWLSTNTIDKNKIELHFNEISYQFVQQASNGIKMFLVNNERKLLPKYIHSIAESPLVKSIHLYDQSGQLIVSAVNEESEAELSINDLYGLSLGRDNISHEYIPFVSEIRTDSLQGYVRITVVRSYVKQGLLSTSNNRHVRIATMILIAFIVGFLFKKIFSGRRIRKKL
jgi:membrane protein